MYWFSFIGVIGNTLTALCVHILVHRNQHSTLNLCMYHYVWNYISVVIDERKIEQCWYICGLPTSFTTRFTGSRTYFQLHDSRVSRHILNYKIPRYTDIFSITSFTVIKANCQLHCSRVSRHISNYTIHGFSGIFSATRFRDIRTFSQLMQCWKNCYANFNSRGATIMVVGIYINILKTTL